MKGISTFGLFDDLQNWIDELWELYGWTHELTLFQCAVASFSNSNNVHLPRIFVLRDSYNKMN